MRRPAAPDGAVVNPRFAAAWDEHRRHVLDVAYRLLGSVSEAEDMVQEAYARLLRADLRAIDDVRGWLTTVTSRLCLDQLRSARARRETYVGPWFPEPVVDAAGGGDPAERVTLDESVRMALLMVLERLSPAERVAFVLHEVFEFSFEEVARIVDRTPAACRQLASRARRRVQAEVTPARFAVDPAEQMRVAERFVAAIESGQLEPLLQVLDPAVAGWADTGGVLDIPLVTGRETVGHRSMAFFSGAERLLVTAVNGEPGVVVLRDGEVRAVLVLTVAGGLITRIAAIADPAKLTHANAALRERLRLGA